jgi:hypothetical protein
MLVLIHTLQHKDSPALKHTPSTPPLESTRPIRAFNYNQNLNSKPVIDMASTHLARSEETGAMVIPRKGCQLAMLAVTYSLVDHLQAGQSIFYYDKASFPRRMDEKNA